MFQRNLIEFLEVLAFILDHLVLYRSKVPFSLAKLKERKTFQSHYPYGRYGTDVNFSKVP